MDEYLHDFIEGKRPEIELKLALAILAIPASQKKYTWLSYCKASGVKLQRSDLDFILGRGVP